MYIKNDKIITNKEELGNYVDGLDIYNSQFIHKFSSPELTREVYDITVYAYRPDLIAQDYYGSDKFMGIVMLQVGRLENLFRGGKILLITPQEVTKILSNI